MGHEPQTVRQMQVEFPYALMELLSSPNRRLARELCRSVPMSKVEAFIEKRFPFQARNPLRKFLAGEFTAGREPVQIPQLHRADVERLCRALDVICEMDELFRLEAKTLAKQTSPFEDDPVPQRERVKRDKGLVETMCCETVAPVEVLSAATLPIEAQPKRKVGRPRKVEPVEPVEPAEEDDDDLEEYADGSEVGVRSVGAEFPDEDP
jgi:hypothetical protein